MFYRLIKSALLEPIPEYWPVLLDEFNSVLLSDEESEYSQKRQEEFRLTLFELTEELLVAFSTVTIYKSTPEFEHVAHSALPYKAALSASACHALCKKTDDRRAARDFYGFAKFEIERVKRDLTPYAHPYEFGDITEPPKLLRAVIG